MIAIFFKINNPFKHKSWKDIYQRSWSVSKNKTLEIQFCRHAYYLFEFNLNLTWCGSDHAGPEFGLNILGWDARIALVDNRHWDGITGWWAS
jgi:hypothetical protein